MTSLQRPLVVGFGLLFLAGLVAVYLLTARQSIQIQVDGRVYAAEANAPTVAAALDAAPQPGQPIVVTRAAVVGVTANGQTTLVRSADPAPLAILQTLGLSLGPGDVLLTDGGEAPAGAAALATAPHLLTLQRAQ